MAAKTGTKHHFAKLTPDLVRQMREWYAEGGITVIELANEFNIANSTAGYALRGQTWKSVEMPVVKTCPTCHGRGKVPK